MKPKVLALLLLITLLALLVHGYHPAVEDGEIYLPGIKKDLNPALYPFAPEFFMSHAHLTLFDELVAGSIRLTHLPFDYAVFLWQIASIFVLLWACWRISRRCFDDPSAHWASVALVAGLLTIPVAGTSLYILDQYITTRALSTPGVMMMIACALERKFVRAALWAVFTAVIHPLMSVFGIAFLFFLVLQHYRGERQREGLHASAAGLGLLLPLGLFPPLTQAYRDALNTRSYFFLLRWEWYEWVGIFAPLALLWGAARYGRKRGRRDLELICRALILFGLFFFFVSLVLTVPARFANLAELQPMRSLQLIYILLFVIFGGILGEAVLKNKFWRWAVLFLPLGLGMFYAQRQLFPATPHLELPGVASPNRWVQAFVWVSHNTPPDAIFALDPYHMVLPGEDQHGFRALAERSMLADGAKDSGAVTMFPALATKWQEQLRATQDWKHFQAADFRNLRNQYGVSWVVLQQPGISGLACPYQNDTVLVCQVP